MDQDKIGKVIKSIRVENNMTQKDLALKLGVTYQAVSKWERGQNIPDIQQLKMFCDLYNLDIKEFMNGENVHKETNEVVKYKNTLLPVICMIIVIGVILGGILFITHHDSFVFKAIKSTSCDFNVSGSAAYSNDQTSIYISNIDYCGEDGDIVYKEISCVLSQIEGNRETKLDEIKLRNISLNDCLDKVTFSIDSHKNSCSSLKNSSIQLTVKLLDDDGKNIVHTISLELEDTCK